MYRSWILITSGLLFASLVLLNEPVEGQVSIGVSSPATSAALEVNTTSKGILIPRMTSAQRKAISSAATGLIVFDNSTSSFWFKSNNAWVELVDTLNNVWKTVANNTVLAVPGSVGIGSNFPNYDLHISRAKPGIYLYDSDDTNPSGTITGDSTHLKINAYRKPFSATDPPGNLLMQIGSGAINAVAGNVGIGISSPVSKLHVYGDQRLNGELIFQSEGVDKAKSWINGNNILFSSTANNLFSQIKLGAYNIQRLRVDALGTKEFGTDAGGSFESRLTITSAGEFNRIPVTSYADLLPVAYGKVKHDGSILGGTGNFTISKTGTGEYKLAVTGETNMYSNRNNYTIIVTPFYKSGEGGESIVASASTYFSSLDANAVRIITTEYGVVYTNTDCDCGNASQEPYSYISSKGYKARDAGFSFMVYKN